MHCQKTFYIDNKLPGATNCMHYPKIFYYNKLHSQNLPVFSFYCNGNCIIKKLSIANTVLSKKLLQLYLTLHCQKTSCCKKLQYCQNFFTMTINFLLQQTACIIKKLSVATNCILKNFLYFQKAVYCNSNCIFKKLSIVTIALSEKTYRCNYCSIVRKLLIAAVIAHCQKAFLYN